MADIPSSKYCPGCKQEKARAEFYQNRRCYPDGLSAYCKICHRANQKKYSYSQGTRREPKSTRRARAVLAAEGIPCTTGKAAGYEWVDLAAWGCIPIEAKGSTIMVQNGNQKVHWAFSLKQQNDGFEDGFFLLLAWFKDDRLPMRSFVVPTSEKWVTHHIWSRRFGLDKEGEPKKALAIRIDSGTEGDLWSRLSDFEGKFDLIEEKRLEIAADLRVAIVTG